MVEDENENLIVCGQFGLDTKLMDDIFTANLAESFVIKLNKNRKTVWSKRIATENSTKAVTVSGIAINSANQITISGGFNDNVTVSKFKLEAYGRDDVYIISMDSSGTINWANRAGGGNQEECRGIAVDDSNNVYITGTAWDFCLFGDSNYRTKNGVSDIFIAKINNKGKFVWVFIDGSESNDFAQSISINRNSLYAAGRFYQLEGGKQGGTATFGWAKLKSPNGNGNIYLAKFDLSKLPTSNKSIEQFTQNSLSLYPNPANNLLYIDGFITGQELIYNIYQSDGKLAQSGTTTNRIDVGLLPKGMYWLKVNNGVQQFQARFVKE